MGRLRLNEGPNLVWVCSGVGIENALSAARWLIAQGVKGLIVAGVSGGLHPGLRSGDLIIAESVREYGEGNRQHTWKTDAAYAKLAHSTLIAERIPVYAGTIVTTPQPVLTVQGKNSLYEQSQALAVDMESAAVARAAGEAKLPFAALRVVCDTSDQTLPPDLVECLGESGQIRLPILLQKLARRPTLIADLIELQRAFAAARTALRRGWQAQIKQNLPGMLTWSQYSG